MTVTLYRENLIANAEEHDPEQLARDFVATLKGEQNPDYQMSGSLRVDDQFGYWLGHPAGMNCTWGREDFAPMIDALDRIMDDDEVRKAVLDALPLPRH